jgi:hypothetical protein
VRVCTDVLVALNPPEGGLRARGFDPPGVAYGEAKAAERMMKSGIPSSQSLRASSSRHTAQGSMPKNSLLMRKMPGVKNDGKPLTLGNCRRNISGRSA